MNILFVFVVFVLRVSLFFPLTLFSLPFFSFLSLLFFFFRFTSPLSTIFVGWGGSKLIYLCPFLVHFNFIWCTDTIYDSEIFPGSRNSFWKMNEVGLSSRWSASWSLSWPQDEKRHGGEETWTWQAGRSYWGRVKVIELEYSYSLLSLSAESNHRQHCRLTICIELVELTNSEYQMTRSK